MQRELSINIDWLTVLQAAKELGVHFTTLYRWIEDGDVVVVRVGGITFVPKSEVKRLKEDKTVIK